VDEEAGVRFRLHAGLRGLTFRREVEGPESRWRVPCTNRKPRLTSVSGREVRAEENEAPPPGSRLTRCKLKGPAGFPLFPGQSSRSTIRQREEGLRAFNLLTLQLAPDLGGETKKVKPVLVLEVVLLVAVVVVLACVLSLM